MAKRSVTIAGHRTSISLEAPFWDALGDIARAEGVSLASIVADVDGWRGAGTSLSAALRVHILAWYRQKRGSRRR